MVQPRRPRFKLLWRGLTLQLFLLTVLPLTALLLLITFGSLRLHQNAMRMMVGELDARAVILAARALEAPLENRAGTLRALAAKAAGVPFAQLEQMLSESSSYTDDFDGGVALLNPDGSLAALRGDRHIWDGLLETAILRLGETGRLSDPGNQFIFLPMDGHKLLAVFVAVPDGQWIAAGAFSLDALFADTLVEGFSGSTHTAIMVVDAAGNLVFQSGPLPEGDPGQHAGVAEALQGEQGTRYVQTEDGEHVVAYSPVSPPGWAIVVEEPWEMVATQLLSNTQLAPLVLVPVLLLAVLALGFGLRQVIQPLQSLESKSADLAWGDFKAIEEPVGGIDEIQRLQHELIHLAHKVQDAQQGLRGFIGAMTTAQEDERHRLARELHDDTLQALIALKQRLQLAQMGAPNSDPLPALREIEALSEQTIQNLRRLTRALRPIYLEDLGLTPALEVLAREAAANMGIPIKFEIQGDERRLDASKELALYRMAQEALSNVAHHARAGQAQVQINFSPDKVALIVSDDGIGFVVPRSPAEFAPAGHYGLLGLHERAELMGARLMIESGRGQGTRIVIHAPASVV